MPSNRVVVRLVPGLSDGDPLHVPAPGMYTRVDPPTLYLEKIGQQWMEARKEARPGVQYILEALPFGYSLWQRPRPSNPAHVDRYLYGHPGKKPFDSPNRFFPHFDAQYKGRPKKITPGLDKSNIDSEGTPDVYRNLIDKLRRHQHVDESIEEPLSPDWRAEQELLPKLLDDTKTNEQWVPRTGDIVLYIRDMPDGVDLVRDETDTKEFRLYDERREKNLGAPQWEAGLVTEAATVTTIADLVDSDQQQNVSNTGVRVEPIPDPNNVNKSLSKQHKYVPLRQIRPFVLWGDLLRRIPQENWHVSIKNALALSSTLSLVGKHRFRGTWPNTSIYCHGIYIGAEMLGVGDTVRLLPNKRQSKCTDVLSIKSIRLKWTNLDLASTNDYDEGRPYNSEVWIYGSAYTSDSSRGNKLGVTEQNVEDKELAIPYSRVLGRLYERDPMAYFLKSDYGDFPTLDVGRQAVVEARAFSRKHDHRIAREPGATWYWGDNRADALNLKFVNGREVSRFDPDRDVKDLRRQLRVLDGVANGEAKPALVNEKGLRRFMAPTLPLRSSAPEVLDDCGSSPSTVSDSGPSRKRTHVIDLEDDQEDEDEDDIDDEIREHTRVVNEDRERPGKKPKVMVVVG
ncbi:unnamed protein product [Alternaria alternata]